MGTPKWLLGGALRDFLFVFACSTFVTLFGMTIPIYNGQSIYTWMIYLKGNGNKKMGFQSHGGTQKWLVKGKSHLEMDDDDWGYISGNLCFWRTSRRNASFWSCHFRCLKEVSQNWFLADGKMDS